MPALHTQHPNSEKLAAFGLGRLSEADSKDIEQHLAECTECRTKLEDIPADSLVCLLQASASDTQAGPAGSSSDTDSSSLSKESVPPLYKKLAQIIGAKPGEGKAAAPAPKAAAIGAAVVKPGFTAPRELDGHARYLVLEPLGAGGMGTVYKAQHRLMERIVALKIVNPLLVTKPGAVERFTREVKAAAQLVHANIVTAYDAEKVGDMHLLVMEFVEGKTLAQVQMEERELPVGKACDYLRQTALGLQHALERGMVHRDIKPQNLMRTSSGEIKILDFGLARFVSEQAQSDGSTEHGSLMGSPDYMAPEQAQDAHSADARADIYGMGCTLYHLLAGAVPFPEASLLAKLEAHRDRQAIPLNHLRSDVPAELAGVVAKMMAKDPAQRYQTPAEVAEALRPFTYMQPSAPLPATLQPASAPSYRKPIAALGIAACLLFLGLGYWLTQIVFRVETANGTLIITSDDPDVQVSVKSAGKEVVLFFPNEKKEIPLKVGAYTIELVGGKDGLKLSTKNFRIESGKGKTVTVEFVPAVAEKKTPIPLDGNPSPEPTPLAEWRKGREFLTVAQKGPADYRTIQEALNALKAGQYVKVLDKGPYRETIIHYRQVADIALVSDIGTRIEVPAWHEWGPSLADKKKKFYLGCVLVGPNGFRLSGFDFTMPPLPPDTERVFAMEMNGAGDFVVESCRLRQHRDMASALTVEEKEQAGRCVSLMLGCWLSSGPKGRVLLQDSLFDGRLDLRGDVPMQVTVQRNWFRAPGQEALDLPTHTQTESVVRHNVVQGRDGIVVRARGPEKTAATAGRYLIANNLIDVDHTPFWAVAPAKEEKDREALSRSLTMQNNIVRSKMRSGLQLHADDLKAMTGVWKLGHNCFGAEPIQVAAHWLPIFAKQPTDLVVAGPFLSEDPRDADYLRIDAAGRVAKSGAGGDLPTYIGPFPPGPAAKDGDWFTRLHMDAKRVSSQHAGDVPVPSVEELLKTRKVLNVAQDGSGDYKTIQAALDKVQANQVIHVKDKGPYRELLRKELPPNVALVSKVGTRIDMPTYEPYADAPEKGKFWYKGLALTAQDGLHISGFEFTGPREQPADLFGGMMIQIVVAGDVIVENCSIHGPTFIMGIVIDPAGKPARVVAQDIFTDQGMEFHWFPGSLTIQRNWIANGLVLNQNNGSCVVRHNVIQTNNSGILYHLWTHQDKVGTAPLDLQIHNNVIETADAPIMFQQVAKDNCLLPGSARIANNIIRSRAGAGIVASADIVKGLKEVCAIGPNSYADEPKNLGASPLIAKGIGDVMRAKHFLSSDPKDADYLRIAADGDLATKGAGGKLPTYFGAFPPGPAPKDGDWFTRMLAKSAASTSAPAPLVFTWPADLLTLPEFLKGREILTVAQDGKAMFTSISAAFDKVKPGQVIKVLDKGPYRESLNKQAPDNVALVSEVGTRIEIPKWHLWGPDGTNKDKNIYQGFVLHSSRGFRLAGFDVICPEVPADSADTIAIELAVGGELVVESCRILHTPRYDRDMTPQDFKGEDYYALRLGTDDPGPVSRQVVRDNYIEGIVDFVRGNATGVFMERNRVIAPRLNPGVRIAPARAGETIIRHNVIHAFNGVYIAPQDPKAVAKARFLIANNVLDVYNVPVWSWSADNLVIAPAVRIQNNIVHSHVKNGMVLPAKEGATIKGLWQLGHNCFHAKLRDLTEVANDTFMFPLEATDLVRSPQFRADDRADTTKYPRIAADGPLAKGGAGGDLPSYIGAFPPGPAPKEGDWFTGLLEAEKRSSAAPTVKDLLAKAQAALDQKKIDKAIGLYTDILRMEPANIEALVLRGVHLPDVGKADLGLEDLNTALKVDPNSTYVRANRSYVFLSMGKSKECIADCDFVLSRDKTGPNAGVAYTNRGAAFQGMGRFDRALADCEQLIKLNPDEIGHILWRGQLHDRLGNIAAATADLARVRKIRPEVKDLPSNLTNIVPQPMPLAEWLQGREIITVSQDGKGQFKRIQDALDVLKAGQCIKVLDKGPYRERLEKTLPEDVGLISEVGTRIELPAFQKVGPDDNAEGKNFYIGSLLNSSRGLRLAGLEFAVPALPADAGNVVGLNLLATGEVVVENCRFLHTPRYGGLPPGAKERPNNTTRAIHFDGPPKASPLTRVFVADNHIEGFVYFHLFPAQIVVERNRIHNWADQGSAMFFNLQRAGEAVIRHNTIHADRSIAFRIFNPPDEDRPPAKLLVANNLFDNLAHPVGFWRLNPEDKDTVPLSRNVRFHNNIYRTGAEFGAVTLTPKDLAEALKHWKLGHNAFLAEPAKSETTFPMQPTDVIAPTPFLSVDPKHADYLRSAVDGPLATGGVGGNLPSYIGPLPPGPAPKDGDWFTRLRAGK